MIPSSFTGSSRPRRQVNLSGRTNNPFANVGSRASKSPAQNAVVHAQQERLQRQRERERPPAAITIQRIWRGHRQRVATKTRWREEWDVEESHSPPHGPYQTEVVCLRQLRLLVQFASASDESDMRRLSRFASRLLNGHILKDGVSGQPSEAWTTPLALLARLAARTIIHFGATKSLLLPFECLLDLLKGLASVIPDHILGSDYYKAMLIAAESWPKIPSYDSPRVESTVCALLQSHNINSKHLRALGLDPKRSSLSAYSGFAWCLLTASTVSSSMNLKSLSEYVDFRLLTAAVENGTYRLSESYPPEKVLWLLAHYIYFGRRSLRDLPEASYVKVVSQLISSCAHRIEWRLYHSTSHTSDGEQLPQFVEQQLLSLVTQDSVTRLLGFLEDSDESTKSEAMQQASSLATYVLILLRMFPRRADDIRMWLFMGGARKRSGSERLPAVKFFYESIRRSTVFKSISREPREVSKYTVLRSKISLVEGN